MGTSYPQNSGSKGMRIASLRPAWTTYQFKNNKFKKKLGRWCLESLVLELGETADELYSKGPIPLALGETGSSWVWTGGL